MAITGDAGRATSSEVDALFKLPLAEFTSARNALVARLKKAGHRADADRAKALPKPSVSAWVVNQLYWHHRELFDRLVEAGERLMQAQAAQQPRESLRELINARRETLATLAEIAANALREAVTALRATSCVASPAPSKRFQRMARCLTRPPLAASPPMWSRQDSRR
jgi:hypothetical protein